MKKTSFFFLFAFFVVSCSDKIETYVTYEKLTPIVMTIEEFRASAPAVESPHSLQNVGKIYTYNQYLFINERGKGIHVIDNRNPSSPIQVAFLNILGNVDMAIRNNILYADCVIDLVRFDVSNPTQPVFLSRQENILPNPYQSMSYQLEAGKMIVDVKREIVREKTERRSSRQGRWSQEATSFSPSSASPSSQNSVGKGGSMARFAIVNEYLYAVSDQAITTINISNSIAQKVNTVAIGWGLETIFPYNNNLFIGSMNGMYILGLQNPAQPTQLAFVGHFPSCDPVVVEGNYAYVTLRVGTTCVNAINELQVYDISNLTQPKLIKTYPMLNPYGLGIQNNILFICEGNYGLKTFDATNKENISNNLREHIQNVHAYDVIPMGNYLMMIGRDGLFQYDITNPRNLKLLSKMTVQ